MPRAVPAHVSTEIMRAELRLRDPYRGIETSKDTLRLRIVIAPRSHSAYEVVIDIDDLAVRVQGEADFVLDAGAIDTLFVAERPPRYGFLTWFGVFARQRGRADQLLIETNESKVAQFVERSIEDWLGLDSGPVRGELRLY